MNFSTNEELFNILQYIIKQSLDNSAAKRLLKTYDYHYLSELKVEEMLGEFKKLLKVLPMTPMELENFLKANSKRGEKEAEEYVTANSLDFMEDILINSFCSPGTIETVKKEFFKRYEKELIVGE